MAGKLQVEELKVGAVMESLFWVNPAEGSRYRFRATHLDGKRAPKVVLSNDARITPGVPCLVRLTEITKRGPLYTFQVILAAGQVVQFPDGLPQFMHNDILWGFLSP